MGRMWTGACLGLLLACGDDVRSEGDASNSGGVVVTDGEVASTGAAEDPEPAISCETVADPGVFIAPAWSPASISGTQECPAVRGSVRIELSTVALSGVVTVGNTVEDPWVKFRNAEGLGGFEVYPDTDGTFAERVLMGRYELSTSLENALGLTVVTPLGAVQIGETNDIEIDIPGLVTVEGELRLDGIEAEDPYAHVFIASGSPNGNSAAVLARMDTGAYSVELPPGTYDFFYGWCDPTEPRVAPLTDARRPQFGSEPRPEPTVLPPNPCYEESHPGFDGDPSSPRQDRVPIARDVQITQDRRLDFDVETVRFSGSLEAVGIALDQLTPLLASDGGSVDAIGSGPDFDARVVATTYAFRAHPGAPPLRSTLVLDQHVHLEAVQEAFALDVTLDESPSPLNFLAPGEELGVRVESEDAAWRWSDLHSLPLSDSLVVFAGGPYLISQKQAYCWPDYEREGLSGWTIEEAIMFDSSETVVFVVPPLARVEVDYRDLSEPEVSSLGIFTTDPGLPDFGVLRAEGGAVLAHGLWPVGSYRVRGDVVEIVDGTTIRVVEESKPLTFELVVDGETQSVGASDFAVDEADAELWRTNATVNRSGWREQGDRIRPARYDVRMRYGGESLANRDVDVGCVTVEG